MLRKLAPALLLALLLLSAACGRSAPTAAPAPTTPVAAPAIAAGGDGPPPTPAAPPPTAQHAGALFAPTSMLELFDYFAVLEMAYGPAPDYRHDVGFRVEGADAYGERIVIYSESANHEVTLWLQDGLISRTEPDYPEMIGTDGNKLGELGFAILFMGSDLHNMAQMDESGVKASLLGTETRDLGALRVQAEHYQLTLPNPMTGEEMLLLDYWVAEIGGQIFLIEYSSDDGYVMKITHFQFR